MALRTAGRLLADTITGSARLPGLALPVGGL